MTRLKQPDPEFYESTQKALVARLDPRSKLRLYENQSLKGLFKNAEQTILKDLKSKIASESLGMVVYEGRFGASPREIRAILQRAAQNPKYSTVTPMAIFDELERISKDRTVYEFLQFEARGKYHDALLFIQIIKEEFCDLFEFEILNSMSMVADEEYDKLLQRYVEHVVASVKKEKIFNDATESYQAPSEQLMKEVESIIGVQGAVEKHRENMLSRLASHKLENPKERLEINVVFESYLELIQTHYYSQRKSVIDKNFQALLALDTDDEKNLNSDVRDLAINTYAELERRYGYTKGAAKECLAFMIKNIRKK